MAEAFLRYYTPVVAVAYVITAGYTAVPKHKPAVIRKQSRAFLFVSLLEIATVVTFISRIIAHFRGVGRSSEAALFFDLSQLLFWITLYLSLITAKEPATLPLLVATILCLLIETVLSLDLIYAWPKRSSQFVYRLVPELSTILVLFFLAAILSTTLVSAQPEGTAEERTSLLSKTDAPTPSSASISSTEADSDEDSGDDSDAEEEELREARKKRLESDSGFAGYLSAFKVFLPLLIPYSDLRMQFYVVILLACTLAQRALNVLHPMQLGIIIDKLASTHNIPWTNVVLWIIFFFLASDSGMETISEFPLQRLVEWSKQRITVTAFDKVMNLSMNFHDDKDSGEVIKAIEQAECMCELFKQLVLDITPCILDVCIAMWYISHLFDAYAMLILVAVSVGFIFITIWMSKFMASRKRNLARAERKESKFLYETIGNWPTITFFNRRKFEAERLAKVSTEQATASYLSNDAFVLLYTAQESCELVGRFATSIFALHRVAIGTSTVGDFVALQSYWETITMPLYILGRSYRQFSSNLINSERLLQLFETPIRVQDRPNAKTITKTVDAVKFSDVSFAYDNLRQVITDLSFTIKRGQTVGVVGETGSGKSTTLKLLMRLYDVTSGSITINDQDIRDIKQDSLRDLFGVVPQETFLFNTNILENVRYGRLNATDEEVMEACKAACIHDKIMSFPKRYHSQVGERGVKLSGGERQRLAIARVLLRDSPIVLLDEATSAMDSATEAKIQKALSTLMQGRTSFIIAHRLSTVAEADKILVIDHGRLVESGPPAELLRLKGRFYDLWMKQQGREAAEQRGEEDDDGVDEEVERGLRRRRTLN